MESEDSILKTKLKEKIKKDEPILYEKIIC